MAKKRRPSNAAGELALDLGQGLEIRQVRLDDLLEQDINARHMSRQMFERLAATIRRDSRLESLPFCAVTDRGIEIISGHHRTRAARAAGVEEVYAIVDTSGLSRDQIKAKQLSHNSISGDDNEDILKQIYRDIADAEAKLEAFIDVSLDDVEVPEVPIDNVQFDLDFRAVTVTFLPHEESLFEEVADKIIAPDDKVYLAEMEQYEGFVRALRKVQKEYDIRAVGTALCRMAEIAENFLGDEPKMRGAGMVAVHDAVGAAWIPEDAGAAFRELADKLRKDGEIGA